MKLCECVAFTGCCVVSAPFVALASIPVAIYSFFYSVPYYLFQVYSNYNLYKSAYQSTLTNGQRVQFGRLEGQDYTKWNGLVADALKFEMTAEQKRHFEDGEFFHGYTTNNKPANPPLHLTKNEAYTTPSDRVWLDRECQRLYLKRKLRESIDSLRAWAKAAIPLIGLPWVLLTETGKGGGSSINLCACGLDDENSRTVHWTRSDALTHHINKIDARFNPESLPKFSRYLNVNNTSEV